VNGQLVSISNENVLLRGCTLRNCKEVICAALYVGSDTKVMKNGAKFSAKKSKLMAEIDKMTLSIFIGQIILSMVMALFNILI
jgi:magnesium-transporting ATPase (P-type)